MSTTRLSSSSAERWAGTTVCSRCACAAGPSAWRKRTLWRRCRTLCRRAASGSWPSLRPSSASRSRTSAANSRPHCSVPSCISISNRIQLRIRQVCQPSNSHIQGRTAQRTWLANEEIMDESGISLTKYLAYEFNSIANPWFILFYGLNWLFTMKWQKSEFTISQWLVVRSPVLWNGRKIEYVIRHFFITVFWKFSNFFKWLVCIKILYGLSTMVALIKYRWSLKILIVLHELIFLYCKDYKKAKRIIIALVC